MHLKHPFHIELRLKFKFILFNRLRYYSLRIATKYDEISAIETVACVGLDLGQDFDQRCVAAETLGFSILNGLKHS